MYYQGTRAELKPGDLIEPSGESPRFVYLSPDLDEAIWESEIAPGEGPGRVYIAEPIGQIEDASALKSAHRCVRLKMTQILRIRSFEGILQTHFVGVSLCAL
jgi:hypothetical protein